MEDHKNIVKTLQEIQSELKAPKNQHNNFGNYNYRNCEDILEALKPILKKHEAAIIVNDDIVQIGDRFYVKSTVSLWCGGEVFQSSAFAREPLERKGMDASQLTGATSSYARKYALNGLFAIDDSKDADSMNNNGNGNGHISKEQLSILRDILIDLGEAEKEGKFAEFLKVKSLEDLPAYSYGTALAALQARRAKKNGK